MLEIIDELFDLLENMDSNIFEIFKRREQSED